MPFETNVFVNCPFDDDFKPLLRPLLFTLVFHGLRPRIATERIESGEQRITKIIGLIEESKYAIHDLSRIKAGKKGDMFRLNMPYELGIDVGCRRFGKPPLDTKRYLVLAAERYAYQAAISDISGADISVHNNDANEIVRVVRTWIANQVGSPVGPAVIWGAFNDCMAGMYDDFEAKGFDIQDIHDLAIPELLEYMVRWLADHKSAKNLFASAASGKSVGNGLAASPAADTSPSRRRIVRPVRSWKTV